MMKSDTGQLTPASAPGYVPALLPAAAGAADVPTRITFFRALTRFWLNPSEIGPHLAADTLTRAFKAHISGISLLILLVAGGLVLKLSQQMDSLHAVRVLVAEIVLRLADLSVSTPRAATWTFVVFLAPVGFELLLLVVALLLMPWFADGDTMRSASLRSYKIVLWSATILFPAVLFSILVLLLLNFPFELPTSNGGIFNLSAPSRSFPVLSDQAAKAMAHSLIVFPAVFIPFFWLGANRYLGPPVGPGFEPFEPRCDQCGYAIVGLPIGGNCPECKQSVRECLPGGRRRPTRWDQSARWSALPALVAVHASVLRNSDFYFQLPVRRDSNDARRFWITSIIMMTAVSTAFLTAADLFGANGENRSHVIEDRTLTNASAALSIILASQFISFTLVLSVGRLQYKIRDARTLVIVACYAIPAIWPLLITIGVYESLNNQFIWEKTIELIHSHRWLFGSSDPQLLVSCAIVAPLTAATLFVWITRITRALRAVRFANA